MTAEKSWQLRSHYNWGIKTAEESRELRNHYSWWIFTAEESLQLRNLYSWGIITAEESRQMKNQPRNKKKKKMMNHISWGAFTAEKTLQLRKQDSWEISLAEELRSWEVIAAKESHNNLIISKAEEFWQLRNFDSWGMIGPSASLWQVFCRRVWIMRQLSEHRQPMAALQFSPIFLIPPQTLAVSRNWSASNL